MAEASCGSALPATLCGDAAEVQQCPENAKASHVAHLFQAGRSRSRRANYERRIAPWTRPLQDVQYTAILAETISMKPHADEKKLFSGVVPILQKDDNPQETAEWLECLGLRLPVAGPERAQFLLEKLRERAFRIGVPVRLQRHDAVYQHHSGRTEPPVSRRPRDRAPHQEHHPLERHGDGRPRQQAQRRHRRAYFHLRLGRHALRSGLQPLLPRQAGQRTARPGLLPGPRHAGHLCAGLSCWAG